MRADTQRHQRNLTVRSELKTLIRKFREALQNSSKDGLQAAYRAVVKRLDQASKRNVIHRKTASRKKARLARQLQKQAAGQ